MADLIAEPAVSGLPLSHGRATLAAHDPGRVTAIAPYPGRTVPGFPAPGQVLGPMVWAGRGMAFLLGEAPPETPDAAITDQSDGWAWVTLSGPDAGTVLARLCPLDLRPAAFPAGTSARTMLQHLSVLMIRDGADRFRIAAYRSMARTLVHEIEAAMQAVAARRAP